MSTESDEKPIDKLVREIEKPVPSQPPVRFGKQNDAFYFSFSGWGGKVVFGLLSLAAIGGAVVGGIYIGNTIKDYLQDE